LVPPFRLALIVTISSAGTPVTDATNCALLWPAAIATDPGVVTLKLLSAMEIVTPALAAASRETVQVAFPAALKLEGPQTREFRELGAGAASPICVERVTPLRLAVTVAVCAEGMLPAVTEKVALLAPLATLTLPGVVSVALSSLKPIATPPAEVLFSETVHVALCPLLRLAGAQVSEERAALADKVRTAF
jgi:hypothetical protein